MNSRERLIRTFMGEEVDRIPISLYEFDGFYDGWIYNYPEYVETLDYARGKTDKMYFWRPERPAGEEILFYGVVESGSIRRIEWNDGDCKYVKTIIETPRGKLTSVSKRMRGIHTSWTVEHLCKDERDAEKVLSLPYEPWRPSVDSFFILDERLGDSGIVMGDIPDALCLTVELFGLSRFIRIYMRNKALIFDLLEFFQERIRNYLRHLLSNGAITLYRIVGPEYATPPFLNPREFDRLVTSYDAELIDLLHSYGGLARLHSHGKVKRVLQSFREMRIDATDPLEPPPDGDVNLREAREILGDEVTLIGNIEERIFEVGDKTDIERWVRRAVEEASDGRFILCPTAMPLTTPLSQKVKENIIHYIDCGLKYGDLGRKRE